MKKLSSCFAALVLVLCFVAATSSVAFAQRAAIGFQFATNSQAPLYGATGKADVCLAVFLLDSNGRVDYVRYGFLGTFLTQGIGTGKYVPVFVAYTPAAGPVPYLIQKCQAQPTLGTLITDPTQEPKLWLTLAPFGPGFRIDVDQFNIGIGVIQANVAVLAGVGAQINSYTQVNVANVATAAGFGGTSEVTWADTPNITKLLNWLPSCGTPYIQGAGYGVTCNPAQQQ